MNRKDACVFIKGHGSKQVVTCVHVEDWMITCTGDEELESVMSSLQKGYTALTVHRGIVHNYLGMQFDFGESGVCAVIMPKYMQEIIEESGVTGRASSPATHNLFHVDENSLLLPELSDRTLIQWWRSCAMLQRGLGRTF